MADPTEVALETTADEAHARDCGVVLAAAGIPARVERQASGWAVLVADGDLARAHAALAAYLEDAVAPPTDDFEYGRTRMGLVIAAALIAIVPFTGFRPDARPAYVAGDGSAARILAGEPWRVVTALMLHADVSHLLGNVVAMAVLATAVCRLLGPGVGAASILLTGAAGNYLNAVLRGPTHVAGGASTAVFGALGILAGMAILRARPPRRRGWVPLAAGLALLGLLGTGEHADLMAHFLGFQVGIGLGMGCAVALTAPPGVRAQRWLGAVTVMVVVGAWLLAMTTTPRR